MTDLFDAVEEIKRVLWEGFWQSKVGRAMVRLLDWLAERMTP